MGIRKAEFAKLIKHPVCWCLLILLFCFNCFLMWAQLGNDGLTEELSEIHQVTLETGVNLNEQEAKLKEIQKGGNDYEKFYGAAAEDAIGKYHNSDMMSILEMKQELSDYYPKGSYKEFIESNYEKLQERVETIKTEGDDGYGFYPGRYYKVHSMLYGKIMKPLMVEMVVLMMLSILFLMDYERMQKTNDITLASKTGRKLMGIKAQTGFLAGMMYSVILMIMTLGMFFLVISFSGLWEIPISSGLMAEVRGILYYPFITFWRLDVGAYLVLSIVVALTLVTLSGILTAALQMFLRNSYMVFILEGLGLLALLVLCFQTTVTWADVVIALNPVSMWFTSGVWFMENDFSTCYPGREFIGIGVTLAIVGIIGKLGWRAYQRHDVK